MSVSSSNPALTQLVLAAGFLSVVLASGCSLTTPILPPCVQKYYQATECLLPIPGSNDTKVQIQCVKGPPSNIYASWEFWFGLGLCIALICGSIIFWRCIRFTKCYKSCKDSIRHEKNRACARMCVRMCPCCDKCCEPYTRPSTKEIQRQLEENGGEGLPYHVTTENGSANHHNEHHHHHPHLDRRRSECVHPAEECEHHLSHVTAGHDTTTPHSHHDPVEDKSLDEVCFNSIQFM